MNIDFHYYATYLAARVAGYTDGEAYTIAHAAQYVDVSDYSDMIKKELLPELPNPTATVECTKKMIAKGAINTATMEKESEAIWSSFHFLPGNLDGKRNYTGDTDWLFGASKYDGDHPRKFKLLCLPNSKLSESMINDIIDDHTTERYYLHLVGIRMHVLADTWAHAFYAGTPSYWVNEVADGSVYDDVRGRRITKCYIKDLTPPAPTSASYSYLGHGRIGHLPDIPFRIYKYHPRWTNIGIIKNNPADYICAFSQMVKAMQCIRYKELSHRTAGVLPLTLSLEIKQAKREKLILELELRKAEDESPAETLGMRAVQRNKVAELTEQVKEQVRKIGQLEEMKQQALQMSQNELEAKMEHAKTAALVCNTERWEGSMQPLDTSPSTTQVEDPLVNSPKLYYEANSYAGIDPVLRDKLNTAFLIDDYKGDTNANAAKIWNKIIKYFYPDATLLKKVYDDNLWLNDANYTLPSADKMDTNYYLFNKAAIEHRRFVQDYLGRKGALPPN